MQYIDSSIIKQLQLPAKDSHKGENGRLTIIGGTKLFHGSTQLALKVASKIVDMLYFSSVEQNYELTQELKKQLSAFICIPQGKEADYIAQSDAILIGPGMVRGDEQYTGTGEGGQQTREKVLTLLRQFSQKQWVLDAGALQTVTANEVQEIGVVNPIVTPHKREFDMYFKYQKENIKNANQIENIQEIAEIVKQKAADFRCIIVLKGKVDIISDGQEVFFNQTGNEGMTKGGTGDVLAGLIAALATKNTPLRAALTGAYINGLAGDELYKTVGPFFNADDLATKVPEILWKNLSS